MDCNGQTNIELLMPAGSLEKLKFAYAYGADAVYAGIPEYSLRATKNAFDHKTIIDGIEYAHAMQKKLYVTMNIFASNSKVNRFIDAFCRIADAGADAFIMSDPGLISIARKSRPKAEIHLSTQANVTNWASVHFWQDIGVKRIILARELSLKDIDYIHRMVPQIELEAFVHGAICIAYSGRCLISNYLNHRNANFGTCTNSCRWEYKLAYDAGSLRQIEDKRTSESFTPLPVVNGFHVTEPTRPTEQFPIEEDGHGTYLMNSKDLCAIELLHELQQVGVCSFKVEGRSKSIYYIATVARAYKNAINDLLSGRQFSPANLRELMATSNRTLMTGFLLRRPGLYGQNFDDGKSLPLKYEYCGQVVDYDVHSSVALISFKNQLSIGDEIDWVTPKETHTQIVREIIDCNKRPLQLVKGGMIAGLPCNFIANGFTLIRKKLVRSLSICDPTLVQSNSNMEL